MRHILLGAMAALAVATGAVARTPKVGEPAPSFTLRTVDGRKITLADLRGKVVLLNFWATWCVPCRAELPTLDAYYELRHDAGLEMFAITTEDSVPLSALKKLFAAMHIPAVKGISGPYATLNAVPTNFVIDRAGVLRYAKAAAFDLDDLNRELVPLLREPAPEATTISSGQ